MFDTWFIEILVGVITVISIAVVTKYKVDEINENHHKMIEKLTSAYEGLNKRVEANNTAIIGLETRSKLTITTNEMDQRYVSKELFRQFEKHMDTRLDQLEDGQREILTILRDRFSKTNKEII